MKTAIQGTLSSRPDGQVEKRPRGRMVANRGRLRVLFLTGALYAAGETRVALAYARALQKLGDEVFFVSSPLGSELVRAQNYPHLVLGTSRERNRVDFSRWVRDVAPDVVVVADYYLFMTRDLQSIFAFEDLATLGVPILSLDNVGLAPHAQVLSWLPLGATHTIGAPPPFIEAIIRPCPPHDPSIPRAGTFYAKVYDEAPTLSDAVREQARREMGATSGDKVAFYALPRWTYALASRDPVLYAYYASWGRLLARYFADLGSGVHVAYVSPRQFGEPGNGGVRLHWLKPDPGSRLFSEARYQSYVLAADVVLSDSILSATLGLALLGQVPAVSLMSSVSIGEGGGEPEVHSPFALTGWAIGIVRHMHRIAPGSVFPFLWFPLGFRDEIERLHRGSAYLEAVSFCEVFDELGTAAKIRALLYDEVRRAEIAGRQRRYTDLVLGTPSFPQLMRQLL